MLIVLVLGVSVCSYMLLQTQTIQKIAVGVVIPEEEDESEVIAQYISTMESVKSISEFHYLAYEEAMNALKNGNLQVVLALPESFYEDIYMGKNTPATVYFPVENSLNIEVFRELLLDGVSIVQISEAGVYASLNAARFKETQMEWNTIGDFIVTRYIETALARDEVFIKYTQSPLGELQVSQYYIVALFTIFLLMNGLNFGFLYESHGKAVEKKLRMYGIGIVKADLTKILVMAGSLWCIGILLYGLLCALSAVWTDISVWFAGWTLAGIAILCLSMAAFFHIMYSLAGSGFQGMSLLIAVIAVMVLCAGTFIPAAYLPEIIAEIGKYTPLHFWQAYSTNILFGDMHIKEVLITIGYVLAGIGVGGFCRWKDI